MILKFRTLVPKKIKKWLRTNFFESFWAMHMLEILYFDAGSKNNSVPKKKKKINFFKKKFVVYISRKFHILSPRIKKNKNFENKVLSKSNRGNIVSHTRHRTMNPYFDCWRFSNRIMRAKKILYLDAEKKNKQMPYNECCW